MFAGERADLSVIRLNSVVNLHVAGQPVWHVLPRSLGLRPAFDQSITNARTYLRGGNYSNLKRRRVEMWYDRFVTGSQLPACSCQSCVVRLRASQAFECLFPCSRARRSQELYVQAQGAHVCMTG